METGTKGPPLRLETLGQYLDDTLEHEAQVLDLLVVAQARGQANQELWDKLHAAALRDDRLTELAFAYEKLGQDRRVRIMPPPHQAQVFLHAARFFTRALGDIEGAQAALERVIALVPGHPDAFEQLKKILEEKNDQEKLVALYLSNVGPKTEKEVALQNLRAALELVQLTDPDKAGKIAQQIIRLDPGDVDALYAICAGLEQAGKYPELARTLEQAVAAEPSGTEDRRFELREKLLELYDDRIPEVERAAPHVEEILAREPQHELARRVAARLLNNKAVGARIAAALEKVHETEGDQAGVAQMLAVQVEQLRGPKKAEAQKRLALLLLELGDDPAAYGHLEAVMTVDPADEEVRERYVALARSLGKQAEASKLLTRAAAAVKDPHARARINLECGRFLAELGDPKRARTVLAGVLEAGEGEVALEAARTLSDLVEEAKGLAPILETVAKLSTNDEERLATLRRLSALYEHELKDLALAIQARKRVLELDPSAEPEELERLLETRGDFRTLAEVLEIRAGAMPIDDDRRAMLLRAAELYTERAEDPALAIETLLRVRKEHGPARDVHALVVPLLEGLGRTDALAEVLASELELAEESERAGLLSWLAECYLNLDRVVEALDAFAEVLSADPTEERARIRVDELCTGGEGGVRLRAAQILVPVYRAEQDEARLVPALEVLADLEPKPAARLAALAEAHDLLDAVGKDRVRTLFLAGRGLREAVQHDVEQVPAWLERVSRSEKGPSKAAVAETLASALRDRAVDHPSIARLAERTGEAYAVAGDLGRAVEAYRRVLELEPDNEGAIERIDHLLAEKGSPDERIALYRSSLARPGSVDKRRGLYLAIGGVQIEHLRAPKQAIATYREALEQLAGDRALRDALLDALSQAEQYPELYRELSVDFDAADESERALLELRLAETAVLSGDDEAAAKHFRGALASADIEVEPEALDKIEAIATSQKDVPLLIAVAERRVGFAEGLERASALERLASLLGERAGDATRAAQHLFEAAEEAFAAGEQDRAVRDYERVLGYEPTTRVALERLIGVHSSRSDVGSVIDCARRLVQLIEERGEALQVVAELAEVAGGRADDLLSMITAIESRLGKELDSVSARALVLERAGRATEAAEALSAMLADEAAGQQAKAAVIALLDRQGDVPELLPTRRALCEDDTRGREGDDLRTALLALFRFELDVAKDRSRAGAALDRVLEADPHDDEALRERARLAIADGDLAKAEACLEKRLFVASDDDARVERAAELAMLRLEQRGDAASALTAIEPFVDAYPREPALRAVALAALSAGLEPARSVKVLTRVAEATDEPAARAEVYEALFAKAPAEALVGLEAGLFEAWLACIDDDGKALEVASRAAAQAPDNDAFWDRAEELARALKRPEPVAVAFRKVLGGPADGPRLDVEVALRVGERGVAFHEEWFDDSEQVTSLLRQVIDLAPSAQWAFERLKLVYNSGERWQELFDLFDRVIGAEDDRSTRIMILEDAVETARDLAGDSERAIDYLEKLKELRPDDAKIDTQLERLYDRHGRHAELIALLLSRLPKLDEEQARATRLRAASLHELGLSDLEGALSVLEPLIEAGDEEAIGTALGWLERTAPARSSPAGAPLRPAYRWLSEPTAGPAVRAVAARLLARVFATQGEDERAAQMLEVTLESDLEQAERVELLRKLTEARSALGDVDGALTGAVAELSLSRTEADEASALDTALVIAGESKEALGRVVDALCEVGGLEEDRTRSLRLLRRASTIARGDLKDDTRAITVDLAILSRSDEDPKAAREAAKKLDRDLQAAKREAERCGVLEQLANLEQTPEAKRAALIEAARIAEHVIGDRARAIKALRRWLTDVPTDVEALSLLIENLRFVADSRALVEALDARAQCTKVPEDAESDRVEIARLFARVLADRPRAIDAYRVVFDQHGSSDELVDELAEVLADDGRDAELADLLASEAARATDRERRAALLARLGDLERRRGRIQASLDAFSSALSILPADPKAQAGLETLIGALSPDDAEKGPLFAAGVTKLAQSFEEAGQMDRWLALVPARLLGTSDDGDKCSLLLRAATLEEETTRDDVRALERTVQAFALRPEHPGVAAALCTRGKRTGRWDLVAPHLLPALATREDIDADVARDLLVLTADWASQGSSVPTPVPNDSRGLTEGLLSAAHLRKPADKVVLEKLIAARRKTPSRALVEALLVLSQLRGGDLDLTREAASVMLRDIGDEPAALDIADDLRAMAAARLTEPDSAAEAALLWALEVIDPILRAQGHTERLREVLGQAALLPIDSDRARELSIAAAKLSGDADAATVFERLYAHNPLDAEAAEQLVRLYDKLGRKEDLARLYGSMADTAGSEDERARLRLVRAELLVELGTPDPAISVLRQTLSALPIHEASVRLLITLLEQKHAHAELCALCESQGDLLLKGDFARALGLFVRAAELAETELEDFGRAARSFKKVVDLEPSAEHLDRFARLLSGAELFEEEAAVLERLEQTRGGDDELSLRLATALGKAGQVERAREQLERAVADGRGSARVREVLSEIYRAAGAWEPLAKLFESEADESDDASTKVERLRAAADIYVHHLRDSQAAVPLLSRAAELVPGDMATLFVLSEALRLGERLTEAREVLGRVLAEFGTRKPKERALVHFELAKLALATKDRTGALTELDSASKIDPAHAGVLALLGDVALEEGQLLRAQRTYRGLLMVLRSQRGDKPAQAGQSQVHKSQVLVELAYIAERQREAERKAEFIDSAFEAAREDEAEYKALVAALDRRGYADLVAKALERELEREDLSDDARTRIELSLADALKKLGKSDEAGTLALRTFERIEGQRGPVARAAESKINALIRELGQLPRLYDALVASAERATDADKPALLLKAATIAEAELSDDSRAADALEGVIFSWEQSGLGSPQEHAEVLARLDDLLSRIATRSGSHDRLARVLEKIVDFVSGEGGAFASVAEPLYRLLALELASGHVDASYALLERAAREDADGDRLQGELYKAITSCPADARFVRLLEDFGRERKRARAVVDALVMLADRASDPATHIKEAYETSLELEDLALSEQLLRRLCPKPGEESGDDAWVLIALAESRFAASDAREAADLWERAARVSEGDDERGLLLRVADLADRVLSDTDRAIRILEELQKREPADREVWAPLADIHRRRGDTEALAALMDVTIPLIDDLPERAGMRLMLAKMLEVTDPDRAADVLTEAIDEDPGNPEAGALLERLYEATGRDDKLVILLERQLDVAKDKEDKTRVVDLGLRIGALRERLGDEEAALDAYHGALDWDDRNLMALRAAVKLHTQREDSLVLSDLLDRLLEVEQGDQAVELSLKVADMKLASGDPPGAERALVGGFKANPKNAELKQRLTALYSERGDRVGLARLTAAEARFVTDARAKRDLMLGAAETIKNEGDQREAVELYAEALELDPTDRDTIFSYLETCANTNQHARGILAVDRALETEKDDPWLLFSRAVLREAVGESDSALDDLELAFDKSGGQYAAELRAHLEAALSRIAQDPSASRRSEASIRLRLAEVAAQGGDVASARAVVDELLARDPNDAAALSALARIEEFSGRPDAAALTYAKAAGLATGADLSSVALRLFDACQQIGRLAIARSGVERAFAADPKDVHLRAALRAVYEQTGAVLELSDLVVQEAEGLAEDARYDKLLEAARLLLYGTGEVSIGPQLAERALEVLELAKAIRAADPDLLQLVSEALAASGRVEEARQVAGELIAAHKGKRSRELGQAFYALYRVESKSGNLSDAIEALAKAFDNQPQHGGIALELGQLAIDLDEQDVAQRAFRAVTLMKADGGSGVTAQDRAIAYFHLGNMAYKQGDARRAKLMLDKSIAEDPTLDAARELLAQL